MRPGFRPAGGNGQARADLGVKVIHIAERDTQVANVPKKPNEFVNTWSVDGFVSEGAQPAELGWGTHEQHFPADDGKHTISAGARHLPESPGREHARAHLDAARPGRFHGFLITHSEAISLADYFTVREGERGDVPADRALRLPPQR